MPILKRNYFNSEFKTARKSSFVQIIMPVTLKRYYCVCFLFESNVSIVENDGVLRIISHGTLYTVYKYVFNTVRV